MLSVLTSLRQLRLGILLILLTGCSVLAAYQLDDLYGEARVQQRMVAPASAEGKLYNNQIKPILDSRCVNCHACYDAPCQLKLNSPEGIDRGISNETVYSGTRLIAATPSRLFIDHQTTSQWRANGFNPVLNERAQNPEANKAGSLLYQQLSLKQRNPLPATDILDNKQFDFSLNRENSCAAIENFSQYASENPLAGMPYGLPAVTDTEHDTLTKWIESGGRMAPPSPPSRSALAHIDQWETFLNQDSNKAQLAARYIYEHLFLADLYFESTHSHPLQTEYFELVRSATPPGQPIEIINTRRPTGAPNVSRPYYRFRQLTATRVTKTHLPYALSRKKMEWMDQLFLQPEYDVPKLPGYENENSNPFKTFKSIPADSRYRFLLEEAKFYIEGFIKGPVCRGQVAVDVINDHFWVFFINPHDSALPMLDGFLEQQVPNLRLPGEEGSNAGVLSYWTTYSKLHQEYLLAKAEGLKRIFSSGYSLDLNLIWDGDKRNDNAALTVFRNSDNASVVKGLIGKPSKTAWIVDYPLLERIHYLLTVDFDVYGNIGHQLNTRLYMDFLRIEGEYNFLALMPPGYKLPLRDYWYRDADKRLSDHLRSYEVYMDQTPDISYHTDNPKTELYRMITEKLGPALSFDFSINNHKVPKKQQPALHELQNIKGIPSSLLAEVTSLMVEDSHGHHTLYTVLANRARSNITSLLQQKNYRLPDEDTITVTYGVTGDYPNAFWSVEESQLPKLVDAVQNLKNENDYLLLMNEFGVRRTNSNFWQHSDKVHTQYIKQQPGFAGRMDYNRIENR